MRFLFLLVLFLVFVCGCVYGGKKPETTLEAASSTTTVLQTTTTSVEVETTTTTVTVVSTTLFNMAEFNAKRLSLEQLAEQKVKGGVNVSFMLSLGSEIESAARGGDFEKAGRLMDEAFVLLESAEGTSSGILIPTDPAELREWIFEKNSPYSREFSDSGYRVPSQEELDELKSKVNMTRKYPEKIRGLFDPGHQINTLNLVYFMDEIRNLGVNTYFVIPEYELKDGSLTHYMSAYTDDYPVSLTQEEAKRVVIHRILLAKKEGLAVVFVPDYPSLFNVGRSNYDINALEPKLEDVALEWAKVAEEYQVEYFAPTNEYEHLLYSNDYSLQEVYSKTNSYYERITPKIRSIYSGKVVYKCGNVGDWKDFKGLSMKGADLFGVGNAYAYAPNQVAADVEDMVKAADEVYERDKTPWFISEFLVFTKEDKINIFRKVETDLPMDKYYTPALNIFKSSEKHAVGFSFMGWTGTGRIRNTTAVPVVKQFYKELLQ